MERIGIEISGVTNGLITHPFYGKIGCRSITSGVSIGHISWGRRQLIQRNMHIPRTYNKMVMRYNITDTK